MAQAISGVYRITNTVSKRIYIGSSYDINERQNKHFSDLKGLRHCNNFIQNSYNKHGEEAFIFEIIEECEKSQCLIREQWYLDNIIDWDKDYNLSRNACGGNNGKLSQSNIEEIFQLNNKGWTNKNISDKLNIPSFTIIKVLNKQSYKRFSENLIALPSTYNLRQPIRNRQIKWLLKYKPLTSIAEYFGINKSVLLQIISRNLDPEIPCPELLEHIRESKQFQGNHKRPVSQYTLDGQFIGNFKSTTEAAKTLNISPGNICACAAGRRNKSGGYKWKYLT